MIGRDLRAHALTGTGALLIAVGFLVGVYWPGRIRIERAEQRLTWAVESIREVPDRAREVENLRRDYEAASGYVNAARPRRITNPRPSDIVELTATLARTAGVTLNSLEPGPPRNWERHREWPVEVALEGDTRGIAAFLHALETSTRRIAVGRVSIASREKGLPVEARVQFSVHSDPEKSAGPADFDDGPAPETAD